MSEKNSPVAGQTDAIKKLRQSIGELEHTCKIAEDERIQIIHNLGEREKELKFIFDLFKHTAVSEVPVENVFREIVDMIPPMWQYPDETSARIIFEGNEYRTTNFIIETQWRHAAEIKVWGKPAGVFEVFYMEETDKNYTGILIWQDAQLLDIISGEIGRMMERRRTEQRIQEYVEDLERARRAAKEYEAKLAGYVPRLKKMKTKADETIEGLNRFISNIGSELHNSLQGIDRLARAAIEDRDNPDNSSRLESELQHIKSFIDDLNTYSAHETGQFQQVNREFDLRNFLREIINPFLPEARSRGTEIVVHFDPLVPDQVAGAADPLQRTLESLLLHSLNNMENGEIVVRVQLEVTAHLLPVFHFCVYDTGHGFGEEDQGRIFMKHTADLSEAQNRSIASGLKLAVARQLVELMGGEIWVEGPSEENTPSNGTAFHFTMWLDVKKDLEDNAACNEWIEADKIRVLIAGHKEHTRGILKNIFECWGWEVSVFENGHSVCEFLEKADEADKYFSLAVLDAELTDVPCYDVIDKLEMMTQLPGDAMILTAYSDFEQVTREAAQHNIKHVLERPLHQKQLYDAVVEAEKAGRASDTPAQPEKMSGGNENREEAPSADMKLLLFSASRISEVMISRALKKRHLDIIGTIFDPEGEFKYEWSQYRAVLIDYDNSGDVDSLIDRINWDFGEKGVSLPLIAIRDKEIQEGDDSGEQRCDITINLADGFDRISSAILEAIDERGDVAENEQSERVAAGDIMNYESAIAYADGDNDLLMELLQIFREEKERYLDKIRKAIAGKDIAGINSHCSMLQSMAANLGASKVLRSLENILEMTARNDLSRIGAAFQELEHNLTEFDRVTVEQEKSRAL